MVCSHRQALLGNLPFDPARLIGGNFVDAMAMVTKSAWMAVGGYNDVRFGWEDYDFWCRLVERGFFGVSVGGSPLADYRVHLASMLRTTTEIEENKIRLVADIERRHPWLSVVSRNANGE